MQALTLEPYNIIQGSRTDSASNPFIVRLKTDIVTMDPFDLTPITAITACFQKVDGTELTVSLGSGITVVGNPILGKLLISLTATQTLTLAVVEIATLELSLTTSGDPFKVQIPLAYSVAQTEC